MPNTAFKKFIPDAATLTRDAVSENLVQTISQSTNFAMNTLGCNHQFKLNGLYTSLANYQDADGALIFDWDAEIFEVQIYNFTAGSLGTTQFDILYSATRTGPFISIFSTQPSISYNATHPTYVGTADVGLVPNAVAPVLTTLPFSVVKGGWLKMNVGTLQSGGKDGGVVIKYRPRN